MQPADRAPARMAGIRPPWSAHAGHAILRDRPVAELEELVGDGPARCTLVQTREPHLDGVPPLVGAAIPRIGDALDRKDGNPLADRFAAGLVIPVDLDGVAECAAPGRPVPGRDRGRDSGNVS